MRILSGAMLSIGAALLFVSSIRADVISTAPISVTVNGAPSPADIVNLSYSSTNGSFSNVSAYAGQINWTLNGSANGSGLSSSFGTYCVDILHDIAINGTYSYNVVDNGSVKSLNTLGGLGLLSPTTAANRLNDIENLFVEAGTISTNDQAAALQIDIWEIVYGSTTAGKFSLDIANGTTSTPPAPSSSNPLTIGIYNNETGWESDANNWLSAIPADGNGVLANAPIMIGLQSNQNPQTQAQAITFKIAGSLPSVTPTPKSLEGATALLCLMCGFASLRRFCFPAKLFA